jgi:DNA-binding beta-propeller fold protein YncE
MIAIGAPKNSYEDWSKQLDYFSTSQVAITNLGIEEKWVKIWGANQSFSNSTKTSFLATNTYPQAIAFNPVNQSIYVVNQLAASLQVFNKSGQLLKEIFLDQNSIPTASPIDIAINSITGEAYVIGSISNQFYVIGLSLELTHTIQLANRPFSVKFNSKSNKVYVQHLLVTTVTILDLKDEFSIQLKELNSIQNSIAVNLVNGTWASLSNEAKKIQIFNEENILIRSFENGIKELESLLFSKDGNQLFTILKNEKKIQVINIAEGLSKEYSSFKNQPTLLHLGFENNLLISTIESNIIIELDENGTAISERSTTVIPLRWAVDLEKDVYYITDPINNRVYFEGDETTSPIDFSDNYKELLVDFQYNPILLKHLRVFYSGFNQMPLIRIGSKSSSGKLELRLISLHKYNSPQHTTAIYDVREIVNEILDGRAFWEVLIPPEQTISMVLYHT